MSVKYFYIFVILLVIVALVFVGVKLNNTTTSYTNGRTEEAKNLNTKLVDEKEVTQPIQNNQQTNTNLVVLNSTPSTYTEFSEEAFKNALNDGKIVYLEFYANWCPTCIAQEPGLIEGLQTLGNDNLVAFRVNYKDDDTSGYEEALAKKYSVSYQHTKVVIKDNEDTVLLNEQGVWNSDTLVSKLTNLTN